MIEFKQEGHGLHHHLSYKSQVMFHPFLHCTSTSYIKGETFKRYNTSKNRYMYNLECLHRNITNYGFVYIF